jgi:hypothetical protein
MPEHGCPDAQFKRHTKKKCFDESHIIALLAARYETTGSTLSFAFWLLAINREQASG